MPRTWWTGSNRREEGETQRHVYQVDENILQFGGNGKIMTYRFGDKDTNELGFMAHYLIWKLFYAHCSSLFSLKKKL